MVLPGEVASSNLLIKSYHPSPKWHQHLREKQKDRWAPLIAISTTAAGNWVNATNYKSMESHLSFVNQWPPWIILEDKLTSFKGKQTLDWYLVASQDLIFVTWKIRNV